MTKEDLTRCDDGDAIMENSAYKHLVSRKRVNVLRPGKGLGNYALIEYESLPKRFRERFEQKYGSPSELLQPEPSAFVLNPAARRYFAGLDEDSFRQPDGTPLPEHTAEACALNASVLDCLLEEVRRQRVSRNRLKNGTRIIWENIAASSERLRAEVGHTLPKSVACLVRKIRAYERDGFASLAPRRFGNSNAVKISEAAGRWLIARRRSRVPVYSIRQIFEEYNAVAPSRGWTPIRSERAVKAYLDRPEVMVRWYDAVYGELAARQKFERKQRTELPGRRDSLWYGDGTKLNLYYKGRDAEGRLVRRTTMVYEVIDAYSEMLLGYCICQTENAEAQRRAFRMAVERAMHKPYEIVRDNQGGQKTSDARDFIGRICRVERFTAPHTPQAKSIEQIFGRFQREVLRRDWRFTGQNITARSAGSRPNLEFVEANTEALYTYEELCEAYARYREVWNDGIHPATGISRREMYRQSVNDETPALTERDLISLFWRETESPSAFTANGITIQVDGRRYTYEVFCADGMPDLDFREANTGRRFHVRYDPDDMSRAWLCRKSEHGTRLLRELRPYAVISRAIQDQTPEEQAFLRATLEANKVRRVRRQAENYALEVAEGVAPEQLGLHTPRLQGLSRRDTERIYDMHVVQPSVSEQTADAEPRTIGETEKYLSNMTFDEATLYNKL